MSHSSSFAGPSGVSNSGRDFFRGNGDFPSPMQVRVRAQFPRDAGIRWDFFLRGTSGTFVVSPSCPRCTRGLSPPAPGRRKSSLAIPGGTLSVLKGSERGITASSTLRLRCSSPRPRTVRARASPGAATAALEPREHPCHPSPGRGPPQQGKHPRQSFLEKQHFDSGGFY